MRVKAKEYYHNAAGDRVPSVTTALGELNKPALVNWANRLGLQGVDVNKYKDELADVGTLTHYLIMCKLQDEVPDISDYTPTQVELARGCFKQYTDWEIKNPITPLISEEPFVSEKYQYGGRLDLYGVSNSEFLLADFKTSASGIFPEMIYQVAAYRNLLIEQGYKVSKAVILRLGRGSTEGAEEKIITPFELDTGFNIFLRCLDIYRLKRNLPAICTGVL